jgi:hypothetical protein
MERSSEVLEPRLNTDSAAAMSRLEGLVVSFILVGIDVGELGESPVERRSVPEVTGDSDAIT